MPTTYSAKSSSLAPYTLTEAQHAAIGRMIRACAEIEDIINLRLAHLADITEGMVLVFLGRSSITKRLAILQLISQAKGVLAEKLFAEAFDNPDFRDLQECRNAVAHGNLLGVDEDGNIAFGVVELQGIDSQKVHMTAHCFHPDSFEILASMAEGVIPQMERAFGLTALRQKRREKVLAPHSKTLPKEQRGSALSRQRRASQASEKKAKTARKNAQRRASKDQDKGERPA